MRGQHRSTSLTRYARRSASRATTEMTKSQSVTTPTCVDQSLPAAAHEKRAQDIGALALIARGDPRQRSLGIIMDRDIVCSEVMTPHLLCIHADAELTEAIATLASYGMRRA